MEEQDFDEIIAVACQRLGVDPLDSEIEDMIDVCIEAVQVDPNVEGWELVDRHEPYFSEYDALVWMASFPTLVNNFLAHLGALTIESLYHAVQTSVMDEILAAIREIEEEEAS